MPKTRQAIKLETRQTKNASHNTAELHWKTASAKGILPPLVQVEGAGDSARCATNLLSHATKLEHTEVPWGGPILEPGASKTIK